MEELEDNQVLNYKDKNHNFKLLRECKLIILGKNSKYKLLD